MPPTHAPRLHAEFMQVWEEGYVATTESFTAMHMQGVAIFSGGRMRRADGSLDRTALLTWVLAAVRGVPYAHLRLQRSPLGLTPPAWVPVAGIRIEDHVRFGAETDLRDENLRRLIGWDEGALDPRKPLWRLQVTPLSDGRVAVGLLMHHAGGDALRTLAFLRTLTTSKTDAAPPPAEPAFGDAVAPGLLELPGIALRSWWAVSDSFGERVRAYFGKPLSRRARRVAVRLLRPLRDRPARPVLVHSGHRAFAGDDVQRAADAVGGTMNDLVVAAALRAGGDDDERVRVRVPVLRRPTEGSRNRVTDAAILGSRTEPVADLVASVRAQLIAAQNGATAGAGADAGREIGYATLVPWLSRPRHLLGARLDDVVVLPASLPDDDLSTFALLYDHRLSVVVTAPLSTPLAPVLDALADTLTPVSAVARA